MLQTVHGQHAQVAELLHVLGAGAEGVWEEPRAEAREDKSGCKLVSFAGEAHKSVEWKAKLLECGRVCVEMKAKEWGEWS